MLFHCNLFFTGSSICRGSSKLHHWAIIAGVQPTLLPSFTNSSLSYLFGEIYTVSNKTSLGKWLHHVAIRIHICCSCQIKYQNRLTNNSHFIWKQNPTLARYTRYKPSELCECVKALHRVFDYGPLINLPAVKEKYSQDKVNGHSPPIC